MKYVPPKERKRRVERKLGDGRVICKCGATLDTYGDRCSASLEVRCDGFERIERAIYDR